PAGGYSAGIAVDNVNGHVYWGNSPDGKIIRADLDGSNQVDVLTGLGYVRDVDIDVENGLIFFGQTIFTGSKGLYKANMDGTGLTALMPSTDPTSLGLDIKNEKVYYQDVTEMRRINYDGTSDISIAYNSPTGFFVDTVNSYVFVGHNVLNKISRMDLDGSNAVDLITSGLDSPHGPLIIGQVINENITVIGLTLTANQTGATYQWVDCDNAYMPIPGETFQSFTASANGNYAVEVYVDSCMVRSACVNINTVGITNEVGYRQQLMYPNPFSDRLYINPTEKVKVQLFNMFGELVGYYDCAEGRMEIIFPGLPKGLYLLQLSGQNNTQVFHVVRD
ncbi:MAG TPA: T9SS type A sorting domain-containing protein, partial [Flavobacteriales bacterium]|nr:T9SS type A sorting domain-containing protein [Flavobacteriales bacterium]